MRLTSNYSVFSDGAPTWRMTIERPDLKQTDTLKLCSASLYLNNVLQHLYNAGIQSVLIEGGKFTLEAFLQQNLFDEIRVFKAENKLGEGLPAPAMPDGIYSTSTAGNDTIHIGIF
jgi:diaminohydroxyphosphoribosylaminopyrimidine deaminase/5-amino-6-(5-phosphoribosylamino)uracil reductase